MNLGVISGRCSKDVLLNILRNFWNKTRIDLSKNPGGIPGKIPEEDSAEASGGIPKQTPRGISKRILEGIIEKISKVIQNKCRNKLLMETRVRINKIKKKSRGILAFQRYPGKKMPEKINKKNIGWNQSANFLEQPLIESRVQILDGTLGMYCKDIAREISEGILEGIIWRISKTITGRILERFPKWIFEEISKGNLGNQ